MTETIFRSSRSEATVSGAAQRPQKRKPSGFSWPQDAQTLMTPTLRPGELSNQLSERAG
jgi:hypothetical protein